MPLDYEAICSIDMQILEQQAFCKQDPDQDEDEEALDDSVLIFSAGDLVASLANALGPDFKQAFITPPSFLSQNTTYVY